MDDMESEGDKEGKHEYVFVQKEFLVDSEVQNGRKVCSN